MRKKKHEHVNLERWLVSYADFITLLFAFFVVMYAISQADMAKFKKVAASIKAAFSAAGPVGMLDTSGTSGGNTINTMFEEQIPGGRINDMPAGKTHTAADPDPDMIETKELLEESISVELGVTDLADRPTMEFDSRGMVIRLAAKDFFEKDSSEVKMDLRPVLDKIAMVLSKSKRHIRVEGHTDPLEANGWDLSTARASWVVKYWLKRFDIESSRVGVAGYSHFRKLTNRKDEWSKGSNRRVEIIVLNNRYE
jgi:chemotaxis protein MotB